MNTRASVAFSFLIALGLFVFLYWIVTPVTTGTAFSETLMEQLGLSGPCQRET